MAKKTQAVKRRGASTDAVRIGIIGGSGLYNMPGLEKPREVRVKTPFGNPSDALVVGTLEGKRVAFLARHARGHRFLPTEINYRANVHAMKQLGVERIISVSAVGSLQEDLKPLDFLIPDQFYDRTRHRVSTFFGDGVVAHVGFDKPVCPVAGGNSRSRLRLRQGARPPRGHVHLHGRAAIFHAGRIACVSPVAF